MLTLYTADTPNGHKATIALQELELAHDVKLVDLNAGEQHHETFAAMSPNHKIPLLVDDGRAIFESGAILIHLADKAGRLLPADGAARSEVLQWLFMQVGSVGPMLGQLWWFRHMGKESGNHNEQALQRYGREVRRLYGVYDQRLAAHEWLAGGAYSIADIATWPWLASHHELGIDMADYPQVANWLARIGARDAVRRGVAQTRRVAACAVDGGV
ncbi:glutathione S-transferase [Duganella sp. FT92W]|uniref:Glutathione S-transferase n=1 Tax=Pseudoduganella rivuli TaxID=2666085 RepID=A0A7X2ISQ3_9BURK|nr:glutathione S-transferase N-terminal domain-containing protein [Pseudoduganella rivuli]MRV75396.1 glutathione S-transferase [Pseudoduganella rivuli]